MKKEYYVPVNYVMQMIQEELSMNEEEIKEFVKGVQVTLRKKDYENELNRNIEMITPEFSHNFIPLKKIEILDDWTKEDIPLTRRSFQNTVYYEYCKSKIDLLEYLHTIIEKNKREIFMLLTCIHELIEHDFKEMEELVQYLDLQFDALKQIRVDDALSLAIPVIQNVNQLKELKEYVKELQMEICKQLYLGSVDQQLDGNKLYSDDLGMIKKLKL